MENEGDEYVGERDRAEWYLEMHAAAGFRQARWIEIMDQAAEAGDWSAAERLLKISGAFDEVVDVNLRVDDGAKERVAEKLAALLANQRALAGADDGAEQG
jgi:hypothetical protein